MPRRFRWGIVLTACGGLLLAACTPPLPPDVLAAMAESQIQCQSGDQQVSVPEEFIGAMSAVGAGLLEVCPDQTITEVGPTEATSLKLIAQAPTKAELDEFAATCTGEVISVPAFAYGVTLSYSIIGAEGLLLSPEVIAGILDGSITSWEDAKIAELNPDIDLTGLPPITVLSVEGGQGSVEAMTAWLSKEAPQAWTAGTVDTLPVGTKYPTVTDLVLDMPLVDGAAAVLPSYIASLNVLPMNAAQIEGQFMTPDDVQLLKVGAAAAEVTVDDKGNLLASPAIGGVPVEGNLDLGAAKIVLTEGQPVVGWPVLGYAHLLICDTPSDPLPLSTAQYVVRLAGQGALETFGVTPMPEPIRVKTFTPLKVTVDLSKVSQSPSPS